MPRTVKVAVSLPVDLFMWAEGECVELGATRSGLFRLALEALRQQRKDQEDDERYVRGYLESPESDDEFIWNDEIVKGLAEENPWE